MARFIDKRRVIWITLMAGCLFLVPSFCRAYSGPGYVLKTYALSGGGEPATSTNYSLMATLGQSSPAGISSSARYINHGGFWYTVSLKKMLLLPLILKE